MSPPVWPAEGEVTVAIGRSDRRPILLVPESDQGTCTGLVLLHVDFRDSVDASATRQVLNGYRNRYAEIRDALAETDMTFTDEDLTEVPLLRLLTDPVDTVADELVGVKNNA